MLKLICFGLFLAFTTACENSGKFSEQTCTSWKDKGFCKDSPYEQFMADNCAKTCGCLEENTVYTDDCTNEAQGACWVAVESHNKERANYHDKKVTWSNDLAAKATDLNQGCEFKHKSTGENLYWTSVNNVEDGKAFVQAVNAWAGERQDMDKQGSKLLNSFYSSQGGPVWGHYTQVIWGKTKQIGCSACSIGKGTVVRCLYNPAGNFLGQPVY